MKLETTGCNFTGWILWQHRSSLLSGGRKNVESSLKLDCWSNCGEVHQGVVHLFNNNINAPMQKMLWQFA
ncbi:hypothetical protein OIU78_007723 [Salix suchowensis]|uniref:Uncharacterized protein n=2 Tax=Salix TaxID=40685 RepID=A0A9Q0YZI2_9ROSI|nr:hypothetical protein OIU78_007723 [Salix suchowensis]KAJ6691467.1 hypothetical protein OIU79_013488 [Salix purpurea]KAJ6715677.1 hypothetical protein OIU74_008426 [Salix koriyanagi]